MKRQIDQDRFPEWRPFADAVRRHGPDTGTWCEAWTVLLWGRRPAGPSRIRSSAGPETLGRVRRLLGGY